MSVPIPVDYPSIQKLDLSTAAQIINTLLTQNHLLAAEQTINFQIDYPRAETDPRELSEIPEIRLWFIRLDTVYPWLPFLLDWKAGELARYTAMLIPHQFNSTEGIQYNPEALEIFVMQKVFVLLDWMEKQGIESRSRVKSMAQMLGYELEEGFFELIQGKP